MSRNDEHLDRYLSGEASLDDLPEELRSEERVLQDLMGSVREEHRASPHLYEAVMQEIRSIPEPLWKRVFDWILRPRTFQLSPATGGLALAAMAAALILVSDRGPAPVPQGTDPQTTATQPDEGDQQVVTRFVFIAPTASSVRITGDFVDWSPEGISLKEERATGIWTVDVPLEPGVYQYGFVIDGVEWRPDPRALSNVDDGFGRENSVVIVSDENAA